MGLLSWWKGNPSSPTPPPAAASSGNGRASGANTEARSREVPGMNGAVEVRRPADVTVFEFGSAVASGDRVTMAGYCPVSDELEPCRWEIIPATGSDAPQLLAPKVLMILTYVYTLLFCLVGVAFAI